MSARARVEQAQAQAAALLDERTATLALLDRVAALRALPAQVLAAVGVDVAFVGSLETPDEITLRSFAGNRARLLQDLVVRAGLGTGGAALAQKRPVKVEDYFGDRSFTHAFDREVGAEGLRAVLAVPIVFGGEVLGVLYGASRRVQDFSDTQVGALQDLGSRAGVQLHVAGRVAAQADAAVQEERKRLSAELHDNLGAMLFTIGAQVRDLHDDPSLSPALAARLSTISSQLSEAGSTLRDSLTALGTGPSSVALPVGLRSDCRAFSARTGTRARTVVLSDLPPLDEHRTATLSSVVREALVNVEKHSDAQDVMVSVVANDGGVLVVVSDDGQVPRDASGASSGLGLVQARERVEQAGGRLSCTWDEDDGGWTVRAWVPAL